MSICPDCELTYLDGECPDCTSHPAPRGVSGYTRTIPAASVPVHRVKSCRRAGHLYTPENTLWKTSKGRKPRRYCRTCLEAL